MMRYCRYCGTLFRTIHKFAKVCEKCKEKNKAKIVRHQPKEMYYKKLLG